MSNPILKQDLADLLQLRSKLKQARNDSRDHMQILDQLVVLVLNMDEDSILEVINNDKT